MMLRALIRKLRRHDGGSVAVEFALVGPLLIGMLMGVMQIGIGMRLAIAASLVVSVVAGLVGGAGGLGSFLALTQSAGNADDTYAVILFLGAVGVALSRLLLRGQQRILCWGGRPWLASHHDDGWRVEEELVLLRLLPLLHRFFD